MSRKEQVQTGVMSVAMIIAWITYAAAHISAAIILFKNVKLWVFLVTLCVPGLGDILSIYHLFRIGAYWPFILYGITIVLWIISSALAKSLDK